MTTTRFPGGADAKAPKFYGRRRGRALRQGQQALLDTMLPEIGIPIDGDPGRADLDPVSLFETPCAAVWLEVGFGGGEHLADLAEAHPDIGLIGCEPYVNGVAKLLTAVRDRNLRNVRVLADDARLLTARLRDASVDRIFVLFPDPWPKKRHWERRFIGPGNLPELARILKPGGELRAATDHPGYLTWMLMHLGRASAFEWLAEGPDDWRRRPADWPPTRYERKSLAGVPHFLRFRRR